MSDKPLMTRRNFLKSMAVASASMCMPSFLNLTMNSVMAQDRPVNPIPGFKDNRVLVVVQMSGGNDGLNMIVPYQNDHYYKARPNLHIKRKNLITMNDRLALHNNMKELKELYDQGKVSIINGVGYPNPNRSHFRSMKIWHTASKGNDVKEQGWINRYFANCCDGKGNHPSSAAGVNVGKQAPEAMRGDSDIGVSVQNPERFQWNGGEKNEKEMKQKFRRMGKVGSEEDGEGTIDYLRQTTANFAMSSSEMLRAARQKRKTPSYPKTGLARDLKKVAGMIAADMPTRVYYVSFGGFDTHDDQKNRHANLMRTFSRAISTFYEDLKMNGQQDRVMTLSFSEFGRRVAENGSAGTDHGAAGPMFLIGDGVNPGLHGEYPSLDPNERHRGDLKHTVDFRSVYAHVLENWFEVDAKSVIGNFQKNQ